ncbi:MAG: AMP-binding protein [Syntrophales bacterium]|nr:AMP-binding protein [Syntrophales bacterium]MDD4339002.1 AMP-binding protein [Syntrophales bacterium]HOG06871.1 AMP-binding protein [Syntrophales bacterium]HPB69856.1 AMP-binding protein [Syntrophales bacterium]HQN26544.1 AMP-binding protein [Syntrophales bacterium]
MSAYDAKPWLKSYDPWVTPEMTIPDETYVDLLEKAIAHDPDRAAFHFLGTTCTYRNLDRFSGRVADYLAARGCGRGDVVGINLPNTPQYLIALAGILRAGCVASGVSPLLTPREMAHQINDSSLKALITLDAIFEQRVQKIGNEIPSVKHCLVTNITDFLPAYKRVLAKALKKVPVGRMAPIAGKEVLPFMDVLRKDQPPRPGIKIDPGDPCLIQYTGGTTGLPKGAVLTHRNMVANITQAVTWFNLKMGGGVACSGFPFFHQAGLYFGLITMSAAYTQCLIPDPRNTDHVCAEIAKYRPAILLHVPSLYQMLMDNPAFAKIDFSRCEVCISGAAPFSKEAITALEAIVGRGKVVEILGMTEASPVITMNPLRGRKKIGSVGIPLQSTRLKLVDVETGTLEVPVGEVGEIIVHGPQVMKGYHNKPEDTAKTLRPFQNETWLYTGDVARMDEDGYFYIADRTKDMIIVGGFKVFSREVEEVLSQHPAVQFCAVVGMTDPKRPDSQLVKAVIQLAGEAAGSDAEAVRKDLLDHCRENLTPYKVPKVIEIMAAIPLTAVGKVDKKALRVKG